MRNIIIILLSICSFSCIAQTDSLELYKRGYETAKKLTSEYKYKLDMTMNAFQELQLQVEDLDNIVKTHEYIMYNDSLQLNIQHQQIKLLNDNLNIYQKEFSRRDKFWNKPWFGSVLGVIGTIAIIHVIDYSLPQ
tara:strand:- start:2207 stop:2611 length:405 start_codon:yes stop_codon:yes gene_type:complete